MNIRIALSYKFTHSHQFPHKRTKQGNRKGQLTAISILVHNPPIPPILLVQFVTYITVSSCGLVDSRSFANTLHHASMMGDDLRSSDFVLLVGIVCGIACVACCNRKSFIRVCTGTGSKSGYNAHDWSRWGTALVSRSGRMYRLNMSCAQKP
jgi:hypothetical protein